MKMSKEDYTLVLGEFKTRKITVLSHYNYIKGTGKYNDLNTRVAWDCLRMVVGSSFILNQYDKGLNDNHIQTAVVKALKETLKEG